MKTVALMGAGWTWGDVPPFPPSCERWGTNNVMNCRGGAEVEQWTRWFDLHPPAHIQTRRPQAWEFYTQQDGARPIYFWESHPDVPGSIAYPKQVVLDYFSLGQQDVEHDFWGSLSWILALAIMEGFERIDLFWFSLMNDQYTKQVPSTRYWIGQARGRGIRCTVHGDSALKYTGPLYGCEALSPPLPAGVV